MNDSSAANEEITSSETIESHDSEPQKIVVVSERDELGVARATTTTDNALAANHWDENIWHPVRPLNL